ncbi:MAG: hypothetical protein HY302_12635 [Opitutae bacterium]|nr:hypothetical protein [Opitutae bacterium]
MIRAYAYLQWMSVRNAVARRLGRLKQPKYLAGAVVGLAYFYLFVFRHVLRSGGPGGPAQPPGLPSEFSAPLAPLGALLLGVIVVLAWIVPTGRAALQFTEAEVAFLFPAPLTRRTLIHFKLLRSQLGILVSAFFLSLIFRRASFLGGGQFLHAAGWWLILSTLNLHFIGASFARESLLHLGVNPARRRLLVLAAVAAAALGGWWWLRGAVAPPTPEEAANFQTLVHYTGTVLGHPPVSWLLAPFRAVVGPFFAAGSAAFVAALPAALALLVLHYFWVVRSDVSFEEASIDLARHRAAKLEAVRAGDWRGRNRPTKPRPVPFALSPRGFAPVAFLWKNLIAHGPLFRLRTWLVACAVAVAGVQWLAADPARLPLLKVVGTVTAAIGGYLFLAGPMFMRREIRQTLPQLDLTKAYPLPGWQIVLGELLSPMTVMTFLQWFVLLVVALSFGATGGPAWLTAQALVVGALGIFLLAPPLCGLMLCLPYAGVLFFPAWADAPGAGGGGVEVIGQRLIFFAGYLVVLAVALIPAAGLAAIGFIIGQWLAGVPLALVLAALIAGAVLAAELAAAVWWLGGRLERFDVAQELPR